MRFLLVALVACNASPPPPPAIPAEPKPFGVLARVVTGMPRDHVAKVAPELGQGSEDHWSARIGTMSYDVYFANAKSRLPGLVERIEIFDEQRTAAAFLDIWGNGVLDRQDSSTHYYPA